MSDPERRIAFPAASADETNDLLYREWLVTNGLGGYACGTLCGVATRRYHGLLISALPNPLGRTMMLTGLSEQLRAADGTLVRLGGDQAAEADGPATGGLVEFRLESGLPVWRYRAAGYELEKRLVMAQRQNTVFLRYKLLAGDGDVRLQLFPMLHMRAADAPVRLTENDAYAVTIMPDRYEIAAEGLPPLRITVHAAQGSAFTVDRRRIGEVLYRIERSRGYDYRGDLWTPGYFHVDLGVLQEAGFVASTERWERMHALEPAEAMALDGTRRRHLIAIANPALREGPAAELPLAADQFLITPAGRIEDSARARAAGYEVRTVIAGYHWFTDWGRDTMISLEGLTLCTGRHAEAGSILRTFSYYIRDGLIPNLFPEGEKDGLYHTADATLWFFHALHRYVSVTGDRGTLRQILPRLVDIIDHHLKGTRFGIHVDPADGLLVQGQQGYQLTWMDAKVGDWVVTPRRGKAVEINALWYNALRLLEGWLREERMERPAGLIGEHADRARQSFNQRFWWAEGGYLYDVVDGENGDDASLRPNQVFAIALDHPVLDPSRWEPVLEIVRRKLLTPVGLRTLGPDHPDYKPKYDGDLRSRDAAYHQGTVWPWLLGPFVDAWLRAHPEDRAGARGFLEPLMPRLGANCLGTIAEIFDAEPPFLPRGCVAQAWSVAELIRAWSKTAPREGD